MKKILRKISTLILVLTLALACASCSFIVKPPQGTIDNLPSSIPLSTQTVVNHLPSNERALLSKVNAVEKTEKTVVAIASSQGQGSGVIVDLSLEGDSENVFYVLTCHHVISGGGEMFVFAVDDKGLNFTDQGYNEDYVFSGVIGEKIIDKNAELSLVGGDQVSDIALLRLNAPSFVAENLEKAKIIDTSVNSVKKGEDVFCIGNPTGELPGTVTFGVISYINRQERFAEAGFMTLIQTDASIYPGSSGGGMFNMYGELVGITNGGNVENVVINFAIPAKASSDETTDRGFLNIVKQLLSTYKNSNGFNYGYVSGRWSLGIQVTEKERVNKTKYLEIAEVIEGGNGFKSGVLKGDVIKSVTYQHGQEKTTELATELKVFSNSVSMLRSILSLNDSFILTVVRGEEEIDVTINLLVGGFIFMDTGVYPEN